MFYIIANLKSNLTLPEINKYIEILDRGLNSIEVTSDIKVVIAPSYLYLTLFKQLEIKYNFLSVSAQNVSEFGAGSHTGDVNSFQLKDFCQYCIVGHSERRKEYNESTESVINKCKNLLNSSIKPIICVSNLQEINSICDLNNILIAFEPLKYIGGAVSAPIEYVNTFLEDSNLSSFIYGGSVNLDNCEQFVKNPKLSGLLVGGFSLNPVDFLKLIQKTNNLLTV